MSDTSTNGAAPPEIGWVRAILSGLAVLAAAFGLCVLGVNTVMTRLTGLSRDVRQWLALTVFLVIVLGIAWALRRLQARGLI